MVTAEQVRNSVKAKKINWVDHHDCGICGIMVGYTIDGDDIRFRSGCGCSWSPDRPVSWQEAADHINRQRRTGQWGDVAAKVAKGFGIDLPPPDAS